MNASSASSLLTAPEGRLCDLTMIVVSLVGRRYESAMGDLKPGGLTASTEPRRRCRTRSAVLPITSPAMPVLATVPITTTSIPCDSTKRAIASSGRASHPPSAALSR